MRYALLLLVVLAILPGCASAASAGSASSMSFEARFAPGEVTLLEPDGTVFTFSASRR